MKFVFASRAVTYNQIVRRHFQGVDKKTAWKRIRRLAKHGYFKIRTMDISGKPLKVVQPLPSIWPTIREKWPVEIDTPHFKSESIEHDVRLTEVFLQLEKLRCFRSFYTENLLQSSASLAEDPRFKDAVQIQADGALAIVDAKGSLQVYGIELELSKKSRDRYRQKLINYYLARGLSGVLYISPEPEIERILARIDDEIRMERESIVHFSYEVPVLQGSVPLIFSNTDRGKLEFR